MWLLILCSVASTSDMVKEGRKGGETFSSALSTAPLGEEKFEAHRGGSFLLVSPAVSQQWAACCRRPKVSVAPSLEAALSLPFVSKWFAILGSLLFPRSTRAFKNRIFGERGQSKRSKGRSDPKEKRSESRNPVHILSTKLFTRVRTRGDWSRRKEPSGALGDRAPLGGGERRARTRSAPRSRPRHHRTRGPELPFRPASSQVCTRARLAPFRGSLSTSNGDATSNGAR